MEDEFAELSNCSSSTPVQNTFSFVPIILAVALFFIDFICWYNHSALFALVVEIAQIIFAPFFLLATIRHILRRHYKNAYSTILASTFLMLVFIVPVFILKSDGEYDEGHNGYAHDLAYYIKLAFHEKQYRYEIENTEPNEKGLRYKEFSWWKGNIDEGNGIDLVYDESDVLGLQGLRPQPMWWEKAYSGPRTGAPDEWTHYCPPIRAYKIKPHFYVVRFACG